MDETKRCRVCGRPLPGSGEPLLEREIECQGCAVEFANLLKVPGTPAVQAFNRARQLHEAREIAAHEALIRRRLENNAAGKHGDDATKDLEDFTDDDGNRVTVVEFKARARATLDALDKSPTADIEAWAVEVSK